MTANLQSEYNTNRTWPANFEGGDLAWLCLGNGFPADVQKLATAIAISMAENRKGDPKESNSRLSYVVGLWQINQHAHPQWTIDQLKDPNVNCQAMMQISNNGANWGAWDTFNSGAYLLFMPVATTFATAYINNTPVPAANLDAGGAVAESDGLPPTSLITDPLSAIASFVSTISSPAFFHRSIEVVIGLVLVVMALIFLNRATIGKVGSAAAIAAV